MFSLIAAPYRAGRVSIRLIALALVGAFGCAGARGADLPLSLADAQRDAVLRSRQLPAQDAAAGAARAMAVAAGQLPDPVLRAGIDNLPLGGPDRFSLGADNMTMRRIGVMQELTGADKRRARAAVYERQADQAGAARSLALAAVERETALAWLERHYAEKMAALAAEQETQARLEIDAADASYRGGRASQADLLAAHAALALAQDRASELERRVRTARILLARWTGTTPDQPLAEPPSMDSIGLSRAHLDSALEHHPQVALMRRQQDVAEAEATLAQANTHADWSVELAYQQRGPAYANMLSVGVSLPLQWDRAKRQDREVAARLAAVEQARAEREETLREQDAATRALIEEWDNGRERQERYRRELIPLARARAEAALGTYRGARGSLADLLAARRDEIAVRLQALQLESDTASVWARLQFLLPDDSIAGAAAQARNPQ